jgi:dihydrofolate reductase
VAKLVYSAITSLDGYISDEHGNFEWGAPDPEASRFINDLERGVGTCLLGRRMFETMVYWETFDGSDDASSNELEFAEIWRSATKIVYSKSLAKVSSAKTRIERDFDPVIVWQLKEESVLDISVGGANLASQAFEVGLVDEMHLFVTPVSVGGGTSAFPEHVRTRFDLAGVDRFASGVVHLHYRFND